MSQRVSVAVTDATATRAVGAALAIVLGAGDLVLLSGGLGAGKTTLTQGIGAGMGVRGQVSSPTFIVARVHPPQRGSVALIHVDAYRITDLDDLETLDLDSTVAAAVTVVEWGEGKLEGLSPTRLEVAVRRPVGEADSIANDNPDGVVDLVDVDDGTRQIEIVGRGPGWSGKRWDELRAALADAGFGGAEDD